VADYIDVTLDHDDQCLCCKNLLWRNHKAFETTRSGGVPNYLCPRCHAEWRSDPSRGLWQLPHYVQRGRLKKRLQSSRDGSII
jgi:hypothetical protein